jgi:hypothetical protein
MELYHRRVSTATKRSPTVTTAHAALARAHAPLKEPGPARYASDESGSSREMTTLFRPRERDERAEDLALASIWIQNLKYFDP